MILDPLEDKMIRSEIVRRGLPEDTWVHVEAVLEDRGWTLVPVESPITDAEADMAFLETFSTAPPEMQRALIQLARFRRFQGEGNIPVIVVDQARQLARDALAKLSLWAAGQYKEIERD